MRNILYTIVILFTSTTIYSQDLEFLKKLDTIYIQFKGAKNEKKYAIQTRITTTDFNEKAYTFILNNKQNFYFEHAKFKSWKKKDANIVSEIKSVDRFFLRKIKNKIINIKDLKKYDNQVIACEIFSQLKTLYIIDYTQKKDKNITLYEVVSYNNCKILE